jgi:hypothetical protein
MKHNHTLEAAEHKETRITTQVILVIILLTIFSPGQKTARKNSKSIWAKKWPEKFELWCRVLHTSHGAHLNNFSMCIMSSSVSSGLSSICTIQACVLSTQQHHTVELLQLCRLMVIRNSAIHIII